MPQESYIPAEASSTMQEVRGGGRSRAQDLQRDPVGVSKGQEENNKLSQCLPAGA